MTDTDDGYCSGREDEIHCYHWWDGYPCCNCDAPGSPTCRSCGEPSCAHDVNCSADEI
ncbi:hypothetical protein [Myxococcus phage Mx1]|nr:hypothetical protein [Myxococcus phage Mx1]